MKTLDQWRRRKLFLEFNGPVGQPDPTGVSQQVLSPGNMGGPASPTMGTQPGMSYPEDQEEDRSEFRRIYDEFLARLRKKKPDTVKQIVDIVQKDVTEIMAQKGLSTNGQQDEQGFPPLGEE